MTMTPAALYAQLISEQQLRPDASQAAVIEELETVHHTLTRKPHFWQRWLPQRPSEQPQGLYLWGSVGTGKTCLVDLFYATLPGQRKRRQHYHVFMTQMHQHMTELQGASDPINRIADRLARAIDVLCLDEFMVKDITNAMLLARLIDALLKRNIVLICTSNIVPDELYLNGLQRQNFLPTIALLKQRLKVMELSSEHDYRAEHPQDAQRFHHPDDEEAAHAMSRQFLHLTEGEACDKKLRIAGRPIAVVQRSQNIAWFDFQALCDVPRHHTDFLHIAQQFPIVFISHMPDLRTTPGTLVTTFMHLVDILYEAGTIITISSAVPLESQEPQDTRQRMEFQRTRSRLQQMLSPHWQQAL